MNQSASTLIETSQVVFEGAPLPHGWRWVRVGDISNLINGDAYKPHEWSTSGVRIIRIQNLNDASKPFNYWSGSLHDRVRVKTGDILLAWSGTPGTSFGTHLWQRGDGVLNQHIFRVDLKNSGVLPTWFVYATNYRLHILIGKAHGGVGLRHVTKGEVEKLEIPLPPISEQKRLSLTLTEQMAAVERARAAAEARLKAAKDLPAAYLRQVFDNSEARQWVKKRIGEVALIIQNGIYKAAEHYGHGHPFLRMYNVQNNSWTLNLDRIALVNLESKEEQTFALKRGDLLISRVNSFELVGKCAWVSPDAEGFVFENMLIRVQLDSSVNSLFVAQQMATDAVRKQIEAVAKRAIGQASINSADLRAIEIALPSLDVQEQIANEVSARVAGAEQASTALQAQLNTINKLPAALLGQAFGGKI